MAIGRIIKPPVDAAQYDAVNAALEERGVSQEDVGMLFHAAGPTEDGGWRIVEIWSSREALDAFTQNVLRPTLADVLGEEVIGGPLPEMELFEVHSQFP